MKIIFLLLILSCFNAYALVRVNKGPAFLLERTQLGLVNQDGLVAMYAPWNGLNEIQNNLLKNKIESNYKGKKIKAPLSLEDNFLKFGYKSEENLYESWDFVATTYGYCHGMTMVTRQMIYYATFNPKIKLKVTYKQDPKRWLDFYEDVVDKIMRGIPQEIPGYKNLADFSSSPIQGYLQRHVADQWGLNTSTTTMLQNAYETNFKKLDLETVKRYKKNLSHYLGKNFYPKVILGPADYNLSDPHVVMVTKLLETSNKSCINFEYFNVGQNYGGRTTVGYYCVGDYMWLPMEEKYYMMDYSNSVR